jgi:hypothetical protein
MRLVERRAESATISRDRHLPTGDDPQACAATARLLDSVCQRVARFVRAIDTDHCLRVPETRFAVSDGAWAGSSGAYLVRLLGV